MSKDDQLWKKLLKRDFDQIHHLRYTYPSPYKALWHAYAIKNRIQSVMTIPECPTAKITMGNVQNGFGIFGRGRAHDHYPFLTVYIGYWKNGERHGKGMNIFRSGEYYEGEWADGFRGGYGYYWWPSNEKYIGEWKGGEICGYGSYEWMDDGHSYAGVWSNNGRNGYGIYQWNGPKDVARVYNGYWRNGVKHGYGVMQWADGRYYRGHWDHGRMDGCGYFRFPDGSFYEGEWSVGIREGIGMQVWSDGSITFDRWVNDLPEDLSDAEKKWSCFFLLSSDEQDQLCLSS